ncbi:MAG: hypothetical protein E7J99_13085 [Clostridium butyricum]|uniref:hypothetical protein n=1 Tax=Clostridium TaxID=1485 RepID=UPI0008A580DF|nr:MULTISPECIES: hypothetical protein [unclassified Clostridium]MDU1114642.1 hypothetical protein [Clostridium sp.]MDU7713084.1 hypothetical protein [Clostridium butyricum]OFS21589.1 hypothetical protein HMPREF3070_12665 [Clostridium sp. HMSC19A10]
MSGKLVALVEFTRNSFGQKYSYLTDIEDLKENDLLLVQTRTSYSLAHFRGYTTQEVFIKVAKSWVVKNLAAEVEEFEEKLLLGELD